MEIRHLLAHRLRQLMDGSLNMDTQTKVANRSGIGQSTVQRLLSCEQSATVDMVDKIAKAFGVKPYEMLVENPDDIALLKTFARLNDVDKARLMGFIELTLSINGQFGHHVGSQLNMDTRAPVPPQLTAARSRASARPPGADITSVNGNGATKQTTRRQHKQ